MKFLIPLFALFVSFPTLSESLFYFAVEKKECVGHTIKFPEKKDEVVFSILGECPVNFIWNQPEKNIVYSMEDGKVFNYSFKSGVGVTKALGSLPGYGQEIWFDSKTKKLTAVTLVFMADKAVKTEKTTNGSKETYTFEGKNYVTTDLPDWGSSIMAILLEYDQDAWRRIDIKPSKSEAGETPGADVLPGYVARQPAFIDMNKIIFASICMGELSCGIEDSIAKKALGEREGYGEISNFHFAVAYGDTPHASSPVFFCTGKCEKPLQLKEVVAEQLSLSLNKNYLLIGEEYTNADGLIYDIKTGNLFFKLPNPKISFWLP